MDVILIQNVKNLGIVDDLVTVADGYAQNFLIKKGLGIIATENNLLKREKRLQDKKNLELDSKDLKIQIEELYLTFKREFNGLKMFGSISSSDVSDELSKFGITIHKRDIKMSKIYSPGDYVAKVSCKNSIYANLNISVSPL